MTMPAVTDMHFFAVVAQRSTLSEAALDLDARLVDVEDVQGCDNIHLSWV